MTTGKSKSRSARKYVVAVAACVTLCLSGLALADGVEVVLGSGGPNPAVATISWGDTINFVNHDGETHTVSARLPNFQPLVIAPGGQVSLAFDGRPGTFSYSQTGGKKKFTGRITVTLDGKISLAANRKAVVYGQIARLSGQTSLLTQPVTIQQRLQHDPRAKGWVDVEVLSPAPDGTFSTTVRPIIGLSYRASTAKNNLASAGITVGVKPILKLTIARRAVPSGSSVQATARITPVAAATQITLLRLVKGKWKTAARAAVSTDGVAHLKWPATAGTTLLKAQVKAPKIANGYVESTSRSVAVTGVGGGTSRHHKHH